MAKVDPEVTGNKRMSCTSFTSNSLYVLVLSITTVSSHKVVGRVGYTQALHCTSLLQVLQSRYRLELPDNWVETINQDVGCSHRITG